MQYMHSVFLKYICVYLYQAIFKFFKSKQGKWGRNLWRHSYRGRGGGSNIIVKIWNHGVGDGGGGLNRLKL